MPGDGKYLKHHAVFSGLSEEQVDAVKLSARLHILQRGKKMVINSVVSNRIYFLVGGKIKIADNPGDNSLLVKDVLYAGEMFGNVSLNGHYTEEYAEALVHNTIVYCFSVDDFKQLLKNHHRLALNYADHISIKLQLLKERYAVWTRHDTRTRLIYLLHKWSLNEGKINDGNILLENYLSLTDIADILSVSRQFLHQLIKEMSESGLLKYSRRQIELRRSLLEETLIEIMN